MREVRFDVYRLRNRLKRSSCFICRGDIAEEDMLWDKNGVIAFLDKYPPTKGYALAAPRRHVREITDLSEREFLGLQRIIHRVAKSQKAIFRPKRIVVFKTGDLLPYLHFHVIPMYKPLRGNMLKVIKKETILDLSLTERAEISRKLRRHL